MLVPRGGKIKIQITMQNGRKKMNDKNKLSDLFQQLKRLFLNAALFVVMQFNSQCIS